MLKNTCTHQLICLHSNTTVGLIRFAQSSLTVGEDVGDVFVTIELFSPILFSPFLFAGVEVTTSPDTATGLD